jgi:hypothetical protein
MTQEGVNIRIVDSTIDITRMSRAIIIQAMTECDLYYNTGIANNFYMNNCNWTGINQAGYGALYLT